eukprot:Skav211956  [mRNA]  locus=scaffold1559:146902:151039:- [translate_table: standard]
MCSGSGPTQQRSGYLGVTESCQGPKFRVGELEGEPVLLKEGEIVEFGICKEPPGDDNDLIKPGRITMKPTIEQLALVKACKVNVVEKLSDTVTQWQMARRVEGTAWRGMQCQARKGVNVPDCEIDCAALTTKDIEDAEYLLQLEPPVEYICAPWLMTASACWADIDQEVFF